MIIKILTSIIFLCTIAFVSSLQAQTLEIRKEESRIFYARGLEESRKGNLDVAIDLYSRAIDLMPDYYEALNSRGVTYLRKRLFDLAINDFSSLFSLRKPSAGLYLNISSAYLGKGDFERALEDIEKAFEINPNLEYGWSFRGDIYRRMKEYQKAIEAYTNAIKINPLSSFYNGRCFTYYDSGKYEEAVADCSEGISLKPNESSPYYYRGLARIKLEQKALAVSDLRKAIEIKPDLKFAQIELEKLLKSNKY